MSESAEDSVQRWTAKRRAALVVSILKGETSIAEAARKHGVTVAEVEDWQQRFLVGAENALRSRPKDEEALKEEHIKKLKQKIGRDTVPFGPRDIRRVKQALPGVSERRSCRVLRVPPSGVASRPPEPGLWAPAVGGTHGSAPSVAGAASDVWLSSAVDPAAVSWKIKGDRLLFVGLSRAPALSQRRFKAKRAGNMALPVR